MKRTRFFWFAVLAIAAITTGMAGGTIPHTISYQGRLTDAGGTAIDGTFNLTFAICTDSLCYSPLWGETHANVVVAQGLFTVLLGSITPIPPSVFTGPDRWLGVSLGGVTFLQRHKFASTAFAFRSLNCDTASYALSVAGEIECSDCNSQFVNVTGPDSVISTSGTAFAGKVIGNVSAEVYGTRGYAANSGGGAAYGGLFVAADSGTGFHYGVQGEAWGKGAGVVEGVRGIGVNTGTGEAYGGHFSTYSNGTGAHFGMRAEGNGASAATVCGTYSTGMNGSSGTVYGGYFGALNGGTGTHYGLYANSGFSSSTYSYGIYSTASNSASGRAYGGSFNATTGGTGYHIGVEAKSQADNSLTSYGVWSEATNTANGDALGGYFRAMSPGTGNHYAISGNAWSASAADAYGCYGWAENTSTGDAYGGYFEANDSGSGNHYGLMAKAYGTTAGEVIGISAISQNKMAGNGSSGGWFIASDSSVGVRIGVGASAPDTDSSWAGLFDGHVWVLGNLQVDGSKSAVVQIDNGERIGLSCQESPEVWFEDFGEGKLTFGEAHIELDPLFLQTVTINADHPMKVFVQLEGDCNGVYVTRGTTGFDVNELTGGTSNASFSYRIVAKRKGYEDQRLPVMKGPAPGEMRAKSAAIEEQMRKQDASRAEERRLWEQERKTSARMPVQTGEE